LKLFQEWGKGGIEEKDGEGEFSYDMRTFEMSQCISSTTIIKKAFGKIKEKKKKMG
jgi:hypothetical protein